MARGKFERQAATSSAKALAVVLVLAMVLCGVVGTTVAWLIAESNDVVNTFTYGDINIDLDETDADEDGNPDENNYEMMPGIDIAKDPKVTVKAGSEANWLFVKLEKTENFDTFLTFTVADGWTQLYDAEGNEVEGVYFRFVPEVTEGEDVVFSVLKDDKVTVKDDVTKEMLNELDPEGQEANYPKLTVTAYAVQYVGFEAEVTEGAEAPTPEQENAAALLAWTKVLEVQTPAEPPVENPEP